MTAISIKHLTPTLPLLSRLFPKTVSRLDTQTHERVSQLVHECLRQTPIKGLKEKQCTDALAVWYRLRKLGGIPTGSYRFMINNDSSVTFVKTMGSHGDFYLHLDHQKPSPSTIRFVDEEGLQMQHLTESSKVVSKMNPNNADIQVCDPRGLLRKPVAQSTHIQRKKKNTYIIESRVYHRHDTTLRQMLQIGSKSPYLSLSQAAQRKVVQFALDVLKMFHTQYMGCGKLRPNHILLTLDSSNITSIVLENFPHKRHQDTLLKRAKDVADFGNLFFAVILSSPHFYTYLPEQQSAASQLHEEIMSLSTTLTTYAETHPLEDTFADMENETLQQLATRISTFLMAPDIDTITSGVVAFSMDTLFSE